jgi:CheY-like chemotaxis protein
MNELVRRSIDPSIAVTITCDPDLPSANVDPNQLELAILNLAINARDAMPRGGTLDIRATAESAGEGQRLKSGNYVCISVRDTGTGMDPQTLARAVEPFFSTKGVGKGTGLGLSMVHGLAAQLGGMLDIVSKPGAGTSATIWLPIATEAATQEASEQRALVTAPRRACILLVDDEELVRVATADMLSDLGYQVVQATSGADALRILRGGDAPDVLVTDYLMPGMNGVELVKAAHALVPELPALLISGYSNIVSGPGTAIPRLAKPFRQANLAEEIAALLSPDGTRNVVSIHRDRSA